MSKMPGEGRYIAIKSYKHDHSFHRSWKDTMVLKTSENELIGMNDHTLVTEGNGRHWVTHEPAVVYFHRKYWFNVVAMLRPSGVVYYCNLASPFVIDREAMKYIDYDLDVKMLADGSIKLLDKEEYQRHKKQWNYSEQIDEILWFNTDIIMNWMKLEKGPFNPNFIKIWEERYRQLRYQKNPLEIDNA